MKNSELLIAIKKQVSLGICLLFTVLAAGAHGVGPGDRLNFISCPLVRDTYVPCWLAQHDGELYYLGPQGDLGADFHPPQLGHKALVEGVVSDQPRICGGVVLEPVKVSVIPELDISCNTILPAAGHDNPPHHRTPGPSNSGLERRRREAPSLLPPFTSREFNVPFSFDVGEHLFSRNTREIVDAARYAEASQATKVKVVGYRSGALLSSGEVLKERDDVASLRAEMVRKMLIHAGVKEAVIQMDFVDVGEPDGISDYGQRRVGITVIP